ncbi:putative Ig domain-containing protein [Chryseolinea sp. T2]|uniref:putative Ig domain-containing protein n=1 Tax=Chryseolinea sp. T2 TaxID=3129255 RepID=UPI0030785CF8
MKKALHSKCLICVYALSLFATSVSAQTPPAGFATVTVSNQWTEAVGLTFNRDGSKMFVWERAGKVWVVANNQKQLMLDISEEVGGWWDHGLLGFVLHPQFEQNGYFYIHYLVDRHYLINYGTPAYNPATNDFYSATISRVTRYTATPSGNGYTVDPASRKILLGETKTTGPASTDRSHVVGAIAFGTDNTLLIGVGDGAAANTDLGSYSGSFYQQALDDGILTPQLNIGVFRSQVLDCLSGKILRIDPETGLGIPSNPFFDPLRPDAPVSKVWALGLRQPFRMFHKDGTGSHSPEDGDPGVFYIGEVGYNTWEELNVMDKPGINFGWPIYEGLTPSLFATINMANTFAPNPLYLTSGCSQQYFNFQDLIKQQTPSGTATFNNPCNTSQGIPSSIPTFVHTRPLIDWKHGSGPSRTGTFSGNTATEVNIGAAGSPVSGPQFGGSASVAGVFYAGTDFPEDYQNTFFFGDYSSGWIRNLRVDGNDRPVAVRNFINSGATVVCMATNPTGEGLYYVNFGSEIRRVYYTANRPPVAVASSDKTFGPTSPVLIQFTGSTSSDPEGLPLTYSWDFGDGSALSTTANPSHTFSAPPGVPTKYVVKLTVRDNQNATDETTINVSVNNKPPNVTITSPADGTLYPMTGETIYQLQADVTDDEHSAAQLSYAWQTILHHNQHEHPDPIDTSPSTTTHISPLGCDGQTYYTRIVLTVTDAAGASTTKEVRVYPDCTGIMLNPEITWPPPAAITQGTELGSSQLNASASYNGTTVVGTFEYDPAPGTVLNAGDDQPLKVTFTPSNTSLFNVVSKTVTIDVQPGSNAIYRAINLNGPALLIDGFSWENGSGAPNLSITNGTAFSNQGVTLVPATDANRATMIRSSVFGQTWGVTLGAIPAGTYQIYLYMWEDNNPETFSISLEGTPVLSNYNSGSTGTWRKLGPFQAIINDGAINLGFTGGSSNLSGLEVWRMGTPPSNQPPIVSNAIPDQTTSANASFNFTFAANTFSDPDAGATLSYVAALSPSGSLPAWLTFTPATRTFSGTPGPGDVGTIQIQVTAFDGIAGGTVSDVFALTVNPGAGLTLYRAININGAALTIDGNNWETGIGAPNLSFTNSTAFSNQSVTLVPTTDANRATMIRSSVWGSNWTTTIGGVPAGTYQIALYVWEDNNPETFTISLEGAVVQSNYNSGSTGTWRRLGPYQATINDGTVSLGFTGGAANLSGVEVWRVGAPTGNQQPVVANPIADQNTNAGTLFNFAFPTNTFTDPDIGSVLSYSASLSPSGSLPSWLSFTPGTRTFSGTPAAADAGTLQIQVTASDGAGGSVSDVFSLTINPPAATTLYRAINLNGPTLTIDGYNWEAGTSAPNLSFTNSTAFTNQSVTLVPSTDANRSTMIRSSVWGRGWTATLGGIPAGTYQIYLYMWEDNNPETFSISLEGTVVLANYNSGSTGTWRRLGPYQATINDGTVSLGFTGGSANLSGLEVWRVGTPAPNQPPVVSNAIPDQSTVAGSLFNFAFAANTFSDPDPGTALSYFASLSPSGSLPAWLTFTPSTRTFSGTPPAGDVGTLQIQVTASDGVAGGTVSDVFTLTINPAAAATLYRAINLNGPALVIDGINWETGTGAPNLSFTNGTAFSNQTVTLVPTTDANRTSMIRSSVYGRTWGVALGGIQAGTYQIYMYMWEDNNPETFSISLEGTAIQSNYNSVGTGVWRRLGPYQTTINDGTINLGFVGGSSNLSGLEVWRVGAPVGNQPPIVANPIADRSINAGSPFNFTFPPNTFSDPDIGTIFSYSSSLSPGGALPAWLSFTPGTRTFSGTPGTGDVGTLQIQVIASDGAGGSISDVFALTISPPAAATLYRAININGPALAIDGNNWEAGTSAPNLSFTNSTAFTNQSVTLVPSTDANRATMIRSSVWGRGWTTTLGSIPAGVYQIYVYVWEDNNPEIFSISLEGTVVLANYNSGSTGTWRRLGPYQATINDGTVSLGFTGGSANLSGLEVWSVNQQSASGRVALEAQGSSTVEQEESNDALFTAFPNPFSDKIKVNFIAEESGAAVLSLYDTRGVALRVLFEGTVTVGHPKTLEVAADNLPDGVYILQLSTGRRIKRIRVALSR